MMVVQHRMSWRPSTKSIITFSSLSFGHLAVGHGHAGLGRDGADLSRPLGQILDAVVHEEHLAAAAELFGDGFAEQLGIEMADEGANGQAVGGRRGDDRDLAQAGQAHLQGARDGRRGQGQHVHLRTHLLEPLLVGHAKALLFVDDDAGRVA
jgi:hypothetical protein